MQTDKFLTQYASPASLCQTFVNGAIGARLRDANAWKCGYDDDHEMCLLRKMITVLVNVIKENLLKDDSNYHGPLRQSHIVIENDMIVLHEPLGSGSDSSTNFRITPALCGLKFDEHPTYHCKLVN